jgi:hypothetical protein
LLPRGAALFAAACYTANPNALLMIYFRSDYAELLASAFFPLLFLATLQLAGILDGRPGSWRRSLVSFSAVLAGVWLSNAPAGVMAAYSVTVLFAWAALTRKSWIPLLRGASGLALGFGLAAFYIVPAAYEQRWVNIAQALSTGLLPSENFLYTTVSDPEHTLFNLIASTIAVAIVVFTGIAAIAVHKELSDFDGTRQGGQLWGAFLLLSALVTALMLRPTAFFWQLLPKLRFVQFPWRWMSILTIPFVYFLAATLARGRFRWLAFIATAALIASTAVFLVQRTWWDDEEFSTLRAAIASGDGFDGTDEYDPVGDDHYNLPAKTPRAQLLPTDEDEENAASRPAGVPLERWKTVVERWTPEDKTVLVESPRPARLALRLLNYPAWQVKVNTFPVRPGSAEDFGQMIIPVRAGQSRITVRLARTLDRTIGGAISVLTLLVEAAVLWLRKETRPGAVSP